MLGSLLHPVLETVGGDFEGLPFGLGFQDALGEGELLYVFGFFDGFDGSVEHVLVGLLGSEGAGVVGEELVLQQGQHAPEEVACSGFNVVAVVVAIHPLLHVIRILLLRQHDLIIALADPLHHLLHIRVHPQNGTLLHLQYPPAGRQPSAIHNFEHRPTDLHIFLVE